MKTIDITTILGTELKSRTSARDFSTYFRNMQISQANVDFSNVKSVTRSFMDEFYNLFIRKDNSMGLQVNLQNMNEQVTEFLKSVERTSKQPRTIAQPANARFLNFTTVSQLNEYLASVK